MNEKCNLAIDINKCPHFIADKNKCNIANKVCRFNKDIEKETPYIKEPKWFEKYYKERVVKCRHLE